MRKNIKLIVCAMLALSLAGCGAKDSGKTAEVETEAMTETLASGGSAVQMANPFETLESKEAVEEKAGFSITLPENLPEWVEETVYRVSIDRLIEIIYTSDDEEIRIRKAEGSEDISGVYDTEGEEKTAEADGRTYRLKLAGDMVRLATWQEDGYTYSVTMHLGMPEEDYLALLAEVK